MHKKLVIAGSVGTGKTTLIENISSISTINSDVKSSVDIGKEFTTVGIDYGHLFIDDKISLGIYGVPGQERFSFIWDLVKEGLWAVVILVKNGHLESIKEIDRLVEHFEIEKKAPCIVCITHADLKDSQMTLRKVQEKLDEKGLKFPVFTINSQSKENAKLIMQTLIAIEEGNNYEQ